VAGYEILGVLGRGAMGVVYKARQRGLKRVVALKMILAGGHAGEHELARFRVEADAVAQLQHPNIVQIYEVGDEDSRPFFSLEYVDGGSLSKKIGGTPQPPVEAAAMVRQLAQGMECAHQNGVIHRDLKPANILLTHDGVPKITDFGLAKRLEDEAGQTHSGTILGTPSYMAPEQAEGKIHEIGPLADVYALGAILYEMLTGRAPFKAASVLDTLHQVRTQEPVGPTQLQPKVPRDLETICLKCLQKDPAKRYETAGTLAEDLRRFQSGEPIKARPVGRVERLWRWCRRNPKVAALLAGVAVALVLWAGTATFLGVQLSLEKDETERQKLQAQTNEVKALREADRANKNKETADANAEKARQGGEKALESLVNLGQEVQARLHSRRLVRQVGQEVRALRDDILGVLRRNMLGLTERLEKTEITPFGRVAAYVSLGDLLQNLGQGEEASGQFQQAYERTAEIVAAQPESDKARGNLAMVLLRLGDIALDLNGDARSAVGYFEQAHQLQKVILEQPRDTKNNPLGTKISLSHTDARLARACLALGRPAAARAHLEEALAYR
jgi:serine/threonine protein kinase